MTWLELAPPVLVVGSFVIALLALFAGRLSKGLAPWVVILAPVATLAVGVTALARIASLGEGQTPAP